MNHNKRREPERETQPGRQSQVETSHNRGVRDPILTNRGVGHASFVYVTYPKTTTAQHALHKHKKGENPPRRLCSGQMHRTCMEYSARDFFFSIRGRCTHANRCPDSLSLFHAFFFLQTQDERKKRCSRLGIPRIGALAAYIDFSAECFTRHEKRRRRQTEKGEHSREKKKETKKKQEQI